MTKAVDLAKTGSLVNSSGQIDLTTGVTGVLPVANGGTGSSSGVSPGGSNTYVQYNNSGSFGGSSSFVFDGTNVGIGTASPSNKLSVVSGATSTIVDINNTTTSGNRYSQLQFRDQGTVNTYIYQNHNGGTLLLRNESSTGSIGFMTNGANERMTIDSSGNVGIGTTSPSALLHLKKNNAELIIEGGTAAYNLTSTLSFSRAYIQTVIQDGTANGDTRMVFATQAAGTTAERMRISYEGNVGINTTTPSGKLSIYGSAIGDIPLVITHAWGSSSTALISASSSAGEMFKVERSGNLLFNSGYGSAAVAYGCRAWVNFNGTGTVAIRASGNVSSITDNGTGDYTINFSSALVDANYSFTGSLKPPSSYSGNNARAVAVHYNTTPTTSAVRVNTVTAGAGYEDYEYVYGAIFR